MKSASSPSASHCTCTHTACPTWGDCRSCVTRHRERQEIPGCFFTTAGEKTYNRSVGNFIKDQSM